jgi:hypothetical protein
MERGLCDKHHIKMSELSVKSTRRKFQGDFYHLLNDTPDPAAFAGGSTFVKPTRRYFY